VAGVEEREIHDAGCLWMHAMWGLRFLYLTDIITTITTIATISVLDETLEINLKFFTH